MKNSVCAIMGVMEAYPIADIPDEFLDDYIMRMDSLGNDGTACLKSNCGWVRKYKDETGPVKVQVEGEINKMKATFKAYQIDMAAKKKALHLSGPLPLSLSMPSANNAQDFISYLQQEKKRKKNLQFITKLNIVQSAMDELLDEVKVRDWEEADNAQIQEAMNRMIH